MFTGFVLLVALSVTLGAPADESRAYYFTRTKKSPSYGSPCNENAHLAPIALYLAPQQPSGGLHYRTEDDEQPSESQTHEHASARSYYEPGSALSGLASAAANIEPSGAPAIGVFPNANLGGCAIPLLLSCSPQVVKGHIVKHGHGAYGAPVPSYRQGGQNSEHKEQAAIQMSPKSWEPERASAQLNMAAPESQVEHHHLMVPAEHGHHHHHHLVSEQPHLQHA